MPFSLSVKNLVAAAVFPLVVVSGSLFPRAVLAQEPGHPSGDSDEIPIGINMVGGFEQGYASSQNASTYGFLAIYGRRLFGDTDKLGRAAGPFYSVRLLTAPQASNTNNIVSVLSDPSGAVTTSSLKGIGSAVDLNVGVEVHLKDAPGGQTSFDFILGGGFVTPVLGNTISQAFKTPDVGTLECSELQKRLSPILAKPIYAGITTTAPTGASGSSCLWNTIADTATPITTLAYATPDQVNFFGKAFGGLRIVNRWPTGDGPKLGNKQTACDTDTRCERGIVDVTFGQNASITGGLMRHFVFNIDVIHPVPVAKISFIYLFGSISKRIGDNASNSPPLVLAPAATLPTTPTASDLTLPLTQPDRDFYRLGAGVSINQIFNALKSKS